MKQNKYDNLCFFQKYQKMLRSKIGLKGAGEWHILEKVLPNLNHKLVLDLGCGFGFHCQFAFEQGAKQVVGVDISQRMLDVAQKTTSSQIEYINQPLEEINFAPETFDVVISSLTFHYIKNWNQIVQKILKILKPKGQFIFSVEHPNFTAAGKQEWYLDKSGNKLHWPIDNYFHEGKRETIFLDEKVIKYHRTITTYVQTLLNNGFQIKDLVEPLPSSDLVKKYPQLKEEWRRPMMLIIGAIKN